MQETESGRERSALGKCCAVWGWAKGNWCGIGSAFSCIIVYCCKTNSVEDEAVGKCSELLPSVAE